ncbi:MAG: isocitrate/isopropylmalate dehydrogenase family protein [Gemmatimonadetes bacterium]|nr:isocitrate/isopropylmalate dehydrogenase family protein [Gemmatimonadota bacterium]MBI3082483.1 isocitrate/isopropylmalate dehydrogenase family protein [Gemmatimonadota bacterium]
MSPRATLIRGDGIGPEITAAALAVLDAAGVRIDWDEQLAGVAAMEETGTPLPDATVESIRQTQVALKGPLTTPVGTGFRSVNVALRKEFDLYANVRPAKSLLPGGRYDHVDIVLVRENTEGLYIGFETTIPMPGEPKAVAASVAIVTRRGCQRVVRYAFEYAVAHRRKKVTICHKANILKAVSGLFLEVGREVSREYAGRVAVDDIIIDACAMKLVLDPTPFDVIVTTNMFGDILSDEIAGLVGGLGLAPGANFGERAAIFEAVHGSAPDIAGKGVANPSALLFAACMMLEHMGEPDAARRIRQALEDTLREGEVRTRDVGGNASTQAFADAVSRRLG